MRMRDVKDATRKKVVKTLPWIFGLVALLSLLKIHHWIFLVISLFFFALLFLAQGLESFTDYKKNFKLSVKQHGSMVGLMALSSPFMYYVIRQDHQLIDKIKEVGLERWLLLLTVVLGLLIIGVVFHFFSWAISSFLAHVSIWLGIQIASLCKWLNPKKPLAPAYLLGQILTVIISLAVT